jgi:hypothetical protein
MAAKRLFYYKDDSLIPCYNAKSAKYVANFWFSIRHYL